MRDKSGFNLVFSQAFVLMIEEILLALNGDR